MKSAKILLIDDNQDDIFLTKRALAHLQIENIDTALGGREAIEYLFGNISHINPTSIINKPDIILLDQRMPQMDGLQFLELVHNALKCHCIPVIVVTSSTLEREKESFFELGVKDYIGKPINVEGLRRAIFASLH